MLPYVQFFLGLPTALLLHHKRQNVRLPLYFKEASYSDFVLTRYLDLDLDLGLDLDLDLLISTLV